MTLRGAGATPAVRSAIITTSVDQMSDRARRTKGPREAAEAAFKTATTKPADVPRERPSVPNAKELVSLRIDRDVLEHFQEGGPGWQDRINDALRKAAGK